MSEDDILREVADAYQGIDDLDGFDDPDALARYRESLLQRTIGQADRIADHLPAAGAIVEVACGNGRLLVELARRGAIGHGLGIDIAATRIAFARRWAQDVGLGDEVDFVAEDLLETPLQAGSYDVAACITGALAYFDPACDGLADQVLARLRGALRPGGTLVLELYPHPRERRLIEAAGGVVRIWHELPAEDPWRFYLSDLHLDPTTQVLTHSKTFIHRTTGEVDTGRRERLLLYTPESLTALLDAASFADVALWEGWTAAPYAGGDVLVATAVAR